MELVRAEFKPDDIQALQQALKRAVAAGISTEDSRYQALLKLSEQLTRPPELTSKPAPEAEGQREKGTNEASAKNRALTAQQLKRLAAQKAALALISRDAPLTRAIQGVLIGNGGLDGALDKRASAVVVNSPLLQAVRDVHSASGPVANLRQAREERVQQQVQWRRETLQRLPVPSSEAVKTKAALELQALKLTNLQRKVRTEVALERKLLMSCQPDQLLDWSMMRLKREDVIRAISRADPERTRTGCVALSSLVGMSPGAIEADERNRKKREADRELRHEENKRKEALQVRRRFLEELTAAYREWIGVQAAEAKRLKQRNDGVLNWHTKEAKRANRAERLRVQALKNDDQEAYLALVAESKNERLKTLLGKTDELLERLGQMVQLQKETDDVDPVEERTRKKNPERHREQGQEGVVSPKAKDAPAPPLSGPDSTPPDPKRDLMAGQKKYNQSVHAIEEKVLVQPQLLAGGQLRGYQLEGLQWMLSLFNNNLNGILADEMGLGKTIQTISLIAYLCENKNVQGPHMIVAPKAVLPNWAHEFKTWAPTLSAVLYDGTLDTRRAIQQDPLVSSHGFTVLLTHYDLVMRDKAFLRKIRWHYFIVDEGHRLKNHESVLATTIMNHYHIKRRLLLTGTPIQNNLQELWSLLNFVLPTIFNNIQNFEDWFNAPFAEKGDLALNEEEEILVIRRLQQVIRPFLLRRKKAEVEKHLPSKVQVVLKSDMSAWQRSYYKQILESSSVAVEGGVTSGKSRSLMNTAMQLRKCCNHPYLFLDQMDMLPDDPDQRVRSSGKFELLDSILPKMQKTGHRILLFSQMTKLMDILEDYLEWRGFKYLRLDGNTKTDERRELLELYNAENSPYFIFLLSTRAGGLGLNLQTADTVIMFDSDWNPAMDQQAEDRAHRIGQKKEVRVFVLVSVGSIEEEILERARSKMGIDAKVIQAGLFNQSSTAAERRELLEEIMRRGTERLGTDVPSEREINRLLARTEDEFQLFEQLDGERRRTTRYTSRLLEEAEVPEWVFLREDESQDVTTSAAENSAPGGKRKRSRISYADPLSDQQWLQIVDEGGDVTKAAEERREAKERRRQKREERERELEEEARLEAEREAELERKRNKKSGKRTKSGSGGTATKSHGSKRKHDAVDDDVDPTVADVAQDQGKKRRRVGEGKAAAVFVEETPAEPSPAEASVYSADQSAGKEEPAAPRRRDRRGKKRRKKGRRPPGKSTGSGDAAEGDPAKIVPGEDRTVDEELEGLPDDEEGLLDEQERPFEDEERPKEEDVRKERDRSNEGELRGGDSQGGNASENLADVETEIHGGVPTEKSVSDDDAPGQQTEREEQGPPEGIGNREGLSGGKAERKCGSEEDVVTACKDERIEGQGFENPTDVGIGIDGDDAGLKAEQLEAGEAGKEPVDVAGAEKEGVRGTREAGGSDRGETRIGRVGAKPVPRRRGKPGRPKKVREGVSQGAKQGVSKGGREEGSGNAELLEDVDEKVVKDKVVNEELVNGKVVKEKVVKKEDVNEEALGREAAAEGLAVQDESALERVTKRGLVVKLKIGAASGASSPRGESLDEVPKGGHRDGRKRSGLVKVSKPGVAEKEAGGDENAEAIGSEGNGVMKRVSKERSRRTPRGNGAVRGPFAEGRGTEAAKLGEGLDGVEFVEAAIASDLKATRGLNEAGVQEDGAYGMRERTTRGGTPGRAKLPGNKHDAKSKQNHEADGVASTGGVKRKGARSRGPLGTVGMGSERPITTLVEGQDVEAGKVSSKRARSKVRP